MADDQDRSVIFIDGNNSFHCLQDSGVRDLGRLNYAKVSEKVVGPRTWIGTRYYVGQVRNQGHTELYNRQRAYLDQLRRADPRISIHLGRLESHRVANKASQRLKRYLADLKVKIDIGVYKDLVALGNATEYTEVVTEKAVDVELAVDMVVMAERNQYDTAYLFSADGDFTPAVNAVRAVNKKVFAVSPANGAQLAAVVNSFIHVRPDWFDDCFGFKSA